MHDCKYCDAVYIGESERAYQTRIGEHISAVRKADTKRNERAEHCWKFNHDFNWTEGNLRPRAKHNNKKNQRNISLHQNRKLHQWNLLQAP